MPRQTIATEHEIHVLAPLDLLQWFDDDGPYYDQRAYEQHTLCNPSEHEISRIRAYLDAKASKGFEIERLTTTHHADGSTSTAHSVQRSPAWQATLEQVGCA